MLDEHGPGRLRDSAAHLLRCPACWGDLRITGASLICTTATCSASYPVVRGTPILVSDPTARLSYRNDFANRSTRWRKLRSYLQWCFPTLVLNVGGKRAIENLLRALEERVDAPVILNIGEVHAGPLTGPVLRALRRVRNATVIHADCALGPGANLVVNWCNLPLMDGSVDAVVIDTGLEHVLDPRQVVSEVHRVLKNDGLVYVDMPFMMPVHAGAMDFSRLSSTGLRALFRDFEEIERGVTLGPAVALSNMIEHLLLVPVQQQWARLALKVITRFALFWMKYLDVLLARQPGAMDAAGGTYFIGRRSSERASDEEVVASYRGAVPSMYEPLTDSNSCASDERPHGGDKGQARRTSPVVKPSAAPR